MKVNFSYLVFFFFSLFPEIHENADICFMRVVWIGEKKANAFKSAGCSAGPQGGAWRIHSGLLFSLPGFRVGGEQGS